ncbi:MAG TPA: agmatine deiminase family protein [Bryobacteraceae bacterium]|nr:agmatine deiminase family protein [Bryobacteraceae bacterium]
MDRLTPTQLGFRLPAEWEPHEATWLAWPHERGDWPGKFAPIPWVYGDIVRRLAEVEKVRILVEDAAAEKAARRVLTKCAANTNAVEFFRHATNRSWTRDTCPVFVRNGKGEVAVTDWIFNGWAKYDNWREDNSVPSFVAKKRKMRRFEPGIVLEGGSIDVNGAGLLLTTEECLLSDSVQVRNPGLTRADLERYFADYFGIRRTIWLGKGIAGDDTHGHIDDLARFVDEKTVVTMIEEDPAEANYAPLRENLKLLRRTGLRVVTLPMPKPVYFDGQRLPASYANFYIANGLVLVPVFNDPNDRIALNSLAKLFPTREVVGIYCGDLVLGLGTLHCMTMQQPASIG